MPTHHTIPPYRKMLDPNCGPLAETLPTKKQFISAIQKDLGVKETGVMTPDLLKKINERFDAMDDNAPTADDENFAALFQGLFDMGALSRKDAENPLKKSVQVFVRSMSDRGISVPAAARAATESGARFFNDYRGTRSAGSNRSVVEVIGGHIGSSSQCVSLTQALTNVSFASGWQRGEQVLGNNTLQPGTAIATFNFGEHGYGPPEHPGGWYGVSHTGIYLGQNKEGIYILDQYKKSDGAQVRFLKFGDPGAEGGSRYFVINTAGDHSAHIAHNIPAAAMKSKYTSPTDGASPPPGQVIKKAEAGKPYSANLTAHS